jgi:hypothetical protein
MSILKLRALDRFGNWGLEVRRSVPTTDAKTKDIVLTAATDAELATYMAGRAKLNPGRVWDGVFKAALNAMDRKTRDEVLANLEDYEASIESGEMEEGPSGSLASTGDEKEDEEEKRKDAGNGATSRVGDAMRKWRGQDHDRIAAMNKANADFWKK